MQQIFLVTSLQCYIYACCDCDALYICEDLKGRTGILQDVVPEVDEILEHQTIDEGKTK